MSKTELLLGLLPDTITFPCGCKVPMADADQESLRVWMYTDDGLSWTSFGPYELPEQISKVMTMVPQFGYDLQARTVRETLDNYPEQFAEWIE